jgi:hypothetical protein
MVRQRHISFVLLKTEHCIQLTAEILDSFWLYFLRQKVFNTFPSPFVCFLFIVFLSRYSYILHLLLFLYISFLLYLG